MMYDTTINGLRLNCLTEEQRARTCSYWYTVTTNCTPHTAFRTREGLNKWLAERGLSLSEPLPENYGEWQSQNIVGSYRRATHSDYSTFPAMTAGLNTRTLSNAEYTLAIITIDDDGIRTVHTLNPNCRSRPTYDYWQSEAVYA